ncbi:alpha/beta hydrolase [Fulvivirga sp. RKSG066]|uniref:alpha/beta hydrolase n=1 Tax=Fulvivirga aurantia TaxID=2529383 RepID=UPI0012BD1ABA|nr:alpha/beta hydrolase [Fulvivirga aurantia]MTI21488.1 alpha/beta hydrolase [Fulvivirga aurantia]
MKKITIPLLIILPLVTFYLLGPRVAEPNLDAPIMEPTSNLSQLSVQIELEEKGNEKIKPDNEARIVWADTSKSKTPYSLVYLHGWSASQEEGDPLHEEIAARYGLNLYLTRLSGHGLKEEEPMLDVTATSLMQSARQAIAVGKKLGEKVIVVATSTGGTMGLYLASQDEDIAGLVLYSPNVEIKDGTSVLLNKPWGLQIARTVIGGDYHQWEIDSPRLQYWTNKYRLEALTHLQELVSETMTKETFNAVNQPVFLGYYYKNEEQQDDVVSVEAMLDMYDQLGTPDESKVKVAFPEAGHHVIASHFTSEDLDGVKQETFSFLEDVMGLKAKPSDTTLVSHHSQ